MSVLVVENLRKSFGNKTRAVRDVSFTVEAGQIFAFLGPNGAGKTTTMKIISGLLRPDTGAVRVAELDPHSDPKALREIGSIMEGNRNTYWRLTAFENIVYFAVHKGLSIKEAQANAARLLKEFNLEDKKNTQVQHLSRGMQQKLAIAIAVAHSPKVLLLDEPTLGLDVPATIQMIETINSLKDSGVAIVLTTHQLDIAEQMADRVAIIKDGEIVREKTKEELIQEFSDEAYQIEFEGELETGVEARLQADFSAQIKEQVISFQGTPEQLYSAIDVIRPTLINRVAKSRPDLTSIFLQLTENNADA